ncbi:MAG: hypothetical protein PUH24_00020 [Prevotellaceae bacterium]|nr:hypothetical protein [Prevotellaceae bacterium]MDY6131545.1 hypothetical protein [Prevotella sp.]
MEIQAIVPVGIRNEKGMEEAVRKIKEMMGAPIRKLSVYYSSVLEQPVNARKTRALVEAQIAFFAGIFPANYPLILRIAFFVWLLMALRKCKNT